MTKAHPLSLEFISLFGLPPVEFVDLAAELGCPYISMALSPFTANPNDYPQWNLKSDKALRTEFCAALKAANIRISLTEGLKIGESNSSDLWSEELDIWAELGAERSNVAIITPNLPHAAEQLAILADMATQRDISLCVEMMPQMPLHSLSLAQKLITDSGSDDIGLLIDAMHYFRAGGTVESLQHCPPHLIHYAQICDVPLISLFPSYWDEALNHRRPPSEGELPLKAFVDALPSGTILGLEIPELAKATQGVSPQKRLRHCIAAVQDLLLSQ